MCKLFCIRFYAWTIIFKAHNNGVKLRLRSTMLQTRLEGPCLYHLKQKKKTIIEVWKRSICDKILKEYLAALDKLL